MRVPKLRLHKSGNYMIRWGGKDHYLGHDQALAHEQYIAELEQWRLWRRGDRASPTARGRKLLVIDIAEKFIESRRLERGADCEQFYRKTLAPFVKSYGHLEADTIRPAILQELKHDLLDNWGPKTINHCLTAIRTMYTWSSGLEMTPPVDLRGAKNLPLGPTAPEMVTVEHVRRVIANAKSKVQPWLAITYLGLLRPTETMRVVAGSGDWIQPGVFRLDRGKMDEHASIKRHCLFSDLALECLARCQYHWSRLGSWSRAASIAGIKAKVLQKSAAAHLIQHHHAAAADVELLLGHVHGRLSVTYYLPDFERLRAVAAQLTL